MPVELPGVIGTSDHGLAPVPRIIVVSPWVCSGDSVKVAEP